MHPLMSARRSKAVGEVSAIAASGSLSRSVAKAETASKKPLCPPSAAGVRHDITVALTIPAGCSVPSVCSA